MLEAINEIAEKLYENYDWIDSAEAIINTEEADACAQEARVVLAKLISLLADCRDQQLRMRVG